MSFSIIEKQAYISLIKIPTKYKNGILTSLICISSLSMGSAWSYENYNDTYNYVVSREAPSVSKISPSSTVLDSCKSLLQSNQHPSSGSNTVKNYHSAASKIAALGVVLGARYALVPDNNNDVNITRHDKKMTGNNRSAQTVAAFRKCQKEHVLSMLTHKK